VTKQGVFVLLGAAVLATPAAAQIDYRNIDDDRPTLIEDAYPIERYAFELIWPYRFERHLGGSWVHSVVPELTYGIGPGAQLGVKLPLAYRSAAGAEEFALAGLRAFALVNLHNESRSLPGLSARLDATAPVGGLAGEGAGVALKLLATRSFGRSRLHLNGSVALVSPDEPAAAEALPRWFAGLAVDRTLLRSSTLLLAEVVVLREERDRPVAVNAMVGLRRQMTPTLVVDAGVGRRLRSGVGPSLVLTLGLSHAFAVRALMPGGSR
jgi:hypothetical protein